MTRCNTVRKLISNAIITSDYVSEKDNVSNSLTKDLSRKVVERSSKGIGS